MDKKIPINYIDIALLTSTNFNPKKSWKELLMAAENIYNNFKKSRIDPEELHNLIKEESSGNTGVPDVSSIENLTNAIDRYINEYKIPDATFLFFEFKRLAAIYLFSIGAQELSFAILKSTLNSAEDTIGKSGNNIDMNMIVLRDCVTLNIAYLKFWLEEFDESKHLIEKVITLYESSDDELYLIKMVNFVSVAFTYLAWIFAKKNFIEDAEKGFFHSLKILNTVKSHSKTKFKDDNFIYTKSKKIFIYDQLINFYSYVEKFEKCHYPLNEILKLMDKSTFHYDIDVTPINHVYYYCVATIYILKDNESINLNKAITYISNMILIIYRNSELFELIPPLLYDKLFYLIEAIRLNYGDGLIKLDGITRKKVDDDPKKKGKNQNLETILSIIDTVAVYFDEIVANYDAEKNFSLNPSGAASSLADSMVTLDRYYKFLRNINFGQFNFINDIIENNKEENLNTSYPNDYNVTEIDLIKLATERMLLKFGVIIKDLVDCRKIQEKIVMEGLNGFLHIENEELVLYSIHRFMARDSQHNIYEETKIHNEEDVRERQASGKKLEILKVFKIKNLEFKFAPLYYKRITFKLNRDAKTFNYSVYLAIINILYGKKLYQPCVSLLSLMIDEIYDIAYDLYDQQKNSQKTNSFLHLYEFLLFTQVYILMKLNKFDRALFELNKMHGDLNEFNLLLFNTLKGLCLSHCYYYDLALMDFADGINICKPLIDEYKNDSENDIENSKKKNKNAKNKNKTPEVYLNEIRMFYSSLQCFALGTIKIYKMVSSNKMKICYRCKNEDPSLNCICFNCKRANYCNKKCLNKNRPLHDQICRIYLEKGSIINSIFDKTLEYYVDYEREMQVVNMRRFRDNEILKETNI